MSKIDMFYIAAGIKPTQVLLLLLKTPRHYKRREWRPFQYLTFFLRNSHLSYDATVSVLSCGSDLFPRWFREEPGDRIVSNTPAGSTGIDTTSGSGWMRPARNIFGTADQIKRFLPQASPCTILNYIARI